MKFKTVFLMFAILMTTSISANASWFGKEVIKKQKYANGSVVLYDNQTCELVLNDNEKLSLNVDSNEEYFDAKDFSIKNGVIEVTSTDDKTYSYNGWTDSPLIGESYPGRVHIYQVDPSTSRRKYVQMEKIK
jgi:hypothetical protein